MKDKISSIGYVNKIRDNILGIRRKNLAPLYQALKSADCVVCAGSGRSLYSLNAAMSQIALSQVGWRNKVVLTPDVPGERLDRFVAAKSPRLSRTHARELPWVQVEISRGPFLTNGEKRDRLIRALNDWCRSAA